MVTVHLLRTTNINAGPLSKRAPNINIDVNNKSHPDQTKFLANDLNKSQFIDLLAKILKTDDHLVHQSEIDADILITSTTLTIARTEPVTVVADDTDILLHHYDDSLHDVFFRSEAKKGNRPVKLRYCNIKDMVGRISPTIKKYILFTHAWGGCDTTSSQYRQGKTSFIKILEHSMGAMQLCDTFYSPSVSQDDINDAGLQLFVLFLSQKLSVSLNQLRYYKFCELIAIKRSLLLPEQLPPTERSAYSHCIRVFLQVNYWSTLSFRNIDPQDWGWKLLDGRYSPIKTDLEVAPSHLLKFIRCKCKITSKNPCSTNICSCRKNGLRCGSACGVCHGTNYRNEEPIQLDVDIEYKHEDLDDVV